MSKTLTNADGKYGQRFEKFHAANPHIFSAMVDVCRETKEKSTPQYSIAGVFEVARWQLHIQSQYRELNEEYKLNNIFKPYYARMIMLLDPSLKNFFDLRSMKDGHTEESRALWLLGVAERCGTHV